MRFISGHNGRGRLRGRLRKGRRFGRLVVVADRGKEAVELLCDCGSVTTVSRNDLRKGHSKSCGCLRREMGRALGLTGAGAQEAGRLQHLGARLHAGRRFGRLVVLDDRGAGAVEVRCDCGNHATIWRGSLRYGLTKSCGCLFLEVVTRLRNRVRAGQRFGRLKVLEDRGANEVEVKCNCGSRLTVARAQLRDGKTQSCGCRQRELTSQRLKATPREIYREWYSRRGSMNTCKGCGHRWIEGLEHCGKCHRTYEPAFKTRTVVFAGRRLFAGHLEDGGVLYRDVPAETVTIADGPEIPHRCETRD